VNLVEIINKNILFCILFGATAAPSPVGQGLLIHEVSRSHTTTQHSRKESYGRMIS